MNTKQVLGFLIHEPRVLLVCKRAPEWQKDHLNGIGGLVCEGETPDAAMTRHGITDLGFEGAWQEYACISRRSWACKVYCATTGHDAGAFRGFGECVAGFFEIDDFRYLPKNMPLVAGVDILAQAALVRVRNPGSPYVILRMEDGRVPHQQQVAGGKCPAGRKTRQAG